LGGGGAGGGYWCRKRGGGSNVGGEVVGRGWDAGKQTKQWEKGKNRSHEPGRLFSPGEKNPVRDLLVEESWRKERKGKSDSHGGSTG